MAIKINVDAGHGSNTAGKRTPDGYREHWINVMTAGFLAASLRRCGFDVMTTGFDDDDATDDPDTSITSRQKAVKAGKCDVSVSCHANADGKGGWTSAEGATTYIHTDPSKAKNSISLAKIVQEELVKGTNQRNRGIGKSNLGMCNAAYMGCDYAILVEIGFMTNRIEAELLKTDQFCKEQAEDICRGFCKFYNVPYAGSLRPDQCQDHGLVPGLYRVSIDNLYIRKGPGTNYDRAKKITPGVYTITEIKSGTGSTAGWGHLKSEAGWISLDYAEFIR